MRPCGGSVGGVGEPPRGIAGFTAVEYDPRKPHSVQIFEGVLPHLRSLLTS